MHARKALLAGVPAALLDEVTGEAAAGRALGPGQVTTRQNRLARLVPLKYDYAYRLKARHPQHPTHAISSTT